MYKISFIVPDREMVGLVESVFEAHPQISEISRTLFTAEGEEPHFLPNLPETDAVISRGFSAQAMRAHSEIPTVELQCTGYDVLTAVRECVSRYGAKKIGIAGTFSMTYGAEAIAEIYQDVEIVSRTVEDAGRLQQILAEMAEAGCGAVVGGRSVSRAAREIGLPAVFLKSGRESIAGAIDEALRTVDVSRAEKRRSDHLAAIMNYTMEGIAATAPDGTVTMMNHFARSLCSCPPPGPLGLNIRACFPSFPYSRLFGAHDPLIGEICMHDDARLVLNAVPLTDEQGIAGYVFTFQRGPQIQEMEDKLRKSINPKGFSAKYEFSHILGASSAIREAKSLAAKFAQSDADILISGETGCGKELFAQGIHSASARSGGPFVAVNCAALPEQLLESELFGYVEGAFTGAARGGKTGLFELAHNGTIFLDEIGDIAPVLQARLLRVIQEREIIRLGHDRITPINVRIIAATNRNLYQRVAEEAFRSDLLYRLEVLKLTIPPLRERPEDIRILAENFFRQEQLRQNRHLVMLAPEALAELESLAWPGNVRELRNFCERLSVLTEHQIAGPDDVYRALGARSERVSLPVPEKNCLPPPPAEDQQIRELLLLHRGSRKKVAAALGIDTSTLWRKMKRYGLHSQL